MLVINEATLLSKITAFLGFWLLVMIEGHMVLSTWKKFCQFWYNVFDKNFLIENGINLWIYVTKKT